MFTIHCLGEVLFTAHCLEEDLFTAHCLEKALFTAHCLEKALFTVHCRRRPCSRLTAGCRWSGSLSCGGSRASCRSGTGTGNGYLKKKMD